MSVDGMVACGDGETRAESDCVVDYNGEFIPSEDAVLMHDGDYALKSECVQMFDEQWALESDCVEMDSGEYCLACEANQLMGGGYCHVDDDNYVYIDSAGEWLHIGDARRVCDEWFHEDDVTTCDCCGENALRDSVDDVHGEEICESCIEEHYSCCDHCSETFLNDDLHYDDGYCYCSDCKPTGVIKNYSCKEANYLRSETTDRLRFGIELEVEARDDRDSAAEYVSEFLGEDYCVLKDDGSLGDGGFEIVTRPDSMAVHKRRWQEFLDDSGTPKRVLSWNTDGRCGMHVHVTKSAMSQLQLGKLLCFINSDANSGLVESIAGRTGERWSRRFQKKVSDVKKHDEDRYVAVNITSKTAEIRIFRGTLKPSSFMKNLEFVQALVEYCAPATASIADATCGRAFCKWVDKKTYPNLHKFLSDRSLTK